MKINYYLEGCKKIEEIKAKNEHPTLLIHACCAPCACYPLLYLNEIFKITIIYNNSNIYPQDEYNRRLNELQVYLDDFNKKTDNPVQLILCDYDNVSYTQKIKHYADEPERGKRCLLCYKLRMKEGFEYAKKYHFDYFTTVMSISRQKDSQVINQIGLKLANDYPEVTYFTSDFKKNDGILKANKIIQEHQMYRQTYCGCVYSYLSSHKN